MNKTNYYSKLAINAMYRASEMAKKIAAEKKLKMPLWKEGKIIYIDSKTIPRI